MPNRASTSRQSSKVSSGSGSPDPELRSELERASADLVYSSESDRPFEFFSLSYPGRSAPPSGEDFANLIGKPDEVVQDKSLLDFFARHTATSDPYDSQAQRIRPRYEALLQTLTTRLRAVRVYRVGKTEIDCYILGLDTHGNLVGLKTVAVET